MATAMAFSDSGDVKPRASAASTPATYSSIVIRSVTCKRPPDAEIFARDADAETPLGSSKRHAPESSAPPIVELKPSSAPSSALSPAARTLIGADGRLHWQESQKRRRAVGSTGTARNMGGGDSDQIRTATSVGKLRGRTRGTFCTG